VVAADPRELAERLERLLGWLREGVETRTGHGVFLGIGAQPRRIGFLFPGQGSPSHLAGGALRGRFEDLDGLYSFLPRAEDGVDTAVAQPAIVTHSLAGLAILERLGIRAGVALGHSLGELTALCWAGACDEETAVRIAAARGRAMAACPPGAMASVDAPAAALELPPSVVVAAFNGPARTVISGDLSSLERLGGYEVRRLRVSHAFHSPLMAGAVPELARHLDGLKPLERPVASTVSGAMLAPGTDLRELLLRQVTSPVRFAEALDAARGLVGLLEGVGAAFALGVPVETGVLFEGRFMRPFDLDRMPRFLANPCESAPVDALVGAGLAPAREGVNPSPTPQAPALEVVRVLVAEKTELPQEAIQDDSRLLSDLHMNSISVGQLVAEAARRLGVQAPASPLDYSRATLSEIARTLETLGASASEPAAPAGVDSWVRAFQVEWVPRELRRRTEEGEGSWRIVAPPGHPLALPLRGDGVLLCLPRDPDESHVGLFLEAARLATTRLVVVGPGGGFARTFHLERPEVATRVVDLPFDHPDAPAWLAAEATAANTAESGYGEARYDDSGRRTVPVLRPLPDLPGEGLPLGPSDVLLVTGGARGIGAECALSLARSTGARLALLGRSRPEDDPGLAANLERMPSPLYVAADVTDPEAVAAAVRRIEAELGPVTALLHAAGTNTPRPISSLDEEAFRRTLAPKVNGLANVLAALGKLRLLVSFGSIIGRAGLEGEADYATANDWLALATERYGREHPECRCLTLEWSVWSGVGMGERLGTLESLIRRGITPIPPDVGVARLRELLSRPLPCSSVVVAGRFGEPPTLEVERPELPLLRFLEKPRVFYPGVELVVDTVLSADTDPHLADHVFRGEPLFAAVLGLEAMAQAAMALLDTREVPVFEQVELRRPVAVPTGRSTTIRIAALVRGPNTVEVVLRDSATGFAADCFRAICRWGGGAPLPEEGRAMGEGMGVRGRLPLDPADLYGGLFFHRGRFRRVEGYRRLRATECLAEIAPDGTASWFGRWLPNELVLGDPGARDAAIHGIQACIPHAVLLPTGVDRIVAARLPTSEPLRLVARERSRQGDDFVYDLEILDTEGRAVERWEGLRLHAVERMPAPGHAALIGPYVERRLQEILPESRVRVALEDGGSDPLHRPDGKPDGPVSRSHAGSLTLSVEGPGRLGCDLEPVAARSAETWRDLLGDRFALAELIARERGETPDAAATRVWAASESLKKAGAPHGVPLTFDRSEADGWLLLRSGDLTIGTWLGTVRELGGPAALAVLVEGRA
jgi:enediyne polyketide synthase